MNERPPPERGACASPSMRSCDVAGADRLRARLTMVGTEFLMSLSFQPGGASQEPSWTRQEWCPTWAAAMEIVECEVKCRPTAILSIDDRT